jgi:hypothetical protein
MDDENDIYIYTYIYIRDDEKFSYWIQTEANLLCYLFVYCLVLKTEIEKKKSKVKNNNNKLFTTTPSLIYFKKRKKLMTQSVAVMIKPIDSFSIGTNLIILTMLYHYRCRR